MLPLTSVSIALALPRPVCGGESYIGSLTSIARSIHQERGFPLEYARRGSWSVDEWRRRARAEVQNHLSYWPKEVPLDIKVESVTLREGYEIRTISFAGSAHYRIPAFLLIPSGSGPFPGVVALHDHGGWFFHGKEKLVRMDGEHVAVRQFREKSYGGRAFAEELAQRRGQISQSHSAAERSGNRHH